MSNVSFNFKGLMAPVFTGFNNDDVRSLNVDNIDEYAAFLKQRHVEGVLVNGTTGEGTVMSVAERKKVAEAWSVASKKHNLTLMVQVGGAPLCDVYELAAHAESLKVDAILCLPELYFKPRTAQDLVNYLKQVGRYCSNTPLLYYHIPMFSGVQIYMPVFCDLAESEIPNFVGIKYTSGDLAEGVDCLKQGRSIFLGADTILVGAVALGFDSAIMTSLNICPELAIEIMDHMKKSEVSQAAIVQAKLSAKVKEILAVGGGDWVPSMKLAFNKKLSSNINVGPVRFPSGQ